MSVTSEMITPGQPVERERCPLAWAHDLVGGRWKQTILWWLSRQPRTFLSLRRRLPGISAKVLTQQLQELVRDGLVEREEEYQGRVRRVRYSVTDSADALVPVLQEFCRWAANHVDKQHA